MKAHGTLVLVWLAAGVFAIGGSILVGSLGKPGLFIGAILGGGLGAVLAVAAATKLGWLAATERRSAAIGAVVGFLIAAPIAVVNLDTPVTPVLVCALAGAGALVGAGVARRS